MIIIFSLLLLFGLYTWLFSLISTANWYYWIFWVLSSFLSTILTFVIVTIIFVLLFKITKFNSKFKHRIVYIYVCFILRWKHVHIEVSGKENIPKKEIFVAFANHKSMIDPVIVYKVCHKVMSAAGKSTLMKVPFLAGLMHSLHVIPIDRDNDREALKALIVGINDVKRGLNMMIFPEGGIKTREVETMHDVKPGAYKLATKANALILPISIIGSSKLCNKKWYKSLHVKVVIAKPITPEEYNQLNTIELGEKVLEIVNQGVING